MFNCGLYQCGVNWVILDSCLVYVVCLYSEVICDV